MENLREIQSLIDKLRNLLPRSSEKELEETAKNLYQLGLLLVRLKIKKHPNPPKTLPMEGFGEETRNSP